MEKAENPETIKMSAKSGAKREREEEKNADNKNHKRIKTTECPYINTIKKYLLDFDFK